MNSGEAIGPTRRRSRLYKWPNVGLIVTGLILLAVSQLLLVWQYAASGTLGSLQFVSESSEILVPPTSVTAMDRSLQSTASSLTALSIPSEPPATANASEVSQATATLPPSSPQVVDKQSMVTVPEPTPHSITAHPVVGPISRRAGLIKFSPLGCDAKPNCQAFREEGTKVLQDCALFFANFDGAFTSMRKGACERSVEEKGCTGYLCSALAPFVWQSRAGLFFLVVSVCAFLVGLAAYVITLGALEGGGRASRKRFGLGPILAGGLAQCICLLILLRERHGILPLVRASARADPFVGSPQMRLEWLAAPTSTMDMFELVLTLLGASVIGFEYQLRKRRTPPPAEIPEDTLPLITSEEP